MTIVEQNDHFEQKLIAAAGDGDISTIRKLLRKKINVSAKDLYDRTALSFASKAGHSEVVRLLLESNDDCVNQKVGYHATALHLASRNHHTEVAKQLILAGAPLETRNCNNLKPVDLCNYNSNTRKIIKDAMAGNMPLIENESEVPEIPKHALPEAPKPKSANSKTKGKKGKGKKKKSGAKKGKKKKGKKRKK